MKTFIVDTEGNGLVPTKFHVLSYQALDDNKIVSLTKHEDMIKFLTQPDLTLISHNHIRWDIPQLERVLDIKITAKLIDTLGLSWYLYDGREKHGLESWGEEFGVPKPPVVDWENEPLEVYIHRCEEDVRITNRLFRRCYDYLGRIYDLTSREDICQLSIVSYLSFKLDCAREQERSGWKVDCEQARSNQAKLEAIKEEKVDKLKLIMPKVAKYDEKTYPKKPFKKDGSLSVEGEKWQKYLSDQGLTKDHRDPILVFKEWEEPNPNSPNQIKEWLFSLGWEPQTFKYVKGDNGIVRAIPQVKKLQEPEFCDSVTELYEKEPGLEDLEDLSIINHRISFLKAILEEQVDGYVKAEIAGLTNTLRFKHVRPCANIPGKGRYWKEIREVFIAEDGYELVGSDMTALEDLTKRHYIYPFDPDYVRAMDTPGFDPHLDLAVHAGVLKPEDIVDVERAKALFKKERQDYKKVNYSGTYGIGADKLSRELRVERKKAAKLLQDFWKRNWSIRKVADIQTVKIVDGQKWLYNPVSKFWYSLREDKDRFSTLNQSTGVYCFDKWIGYIRERRPQLTAQFHDEIVLQIKQGFFEKAVKLLQESIDKVNDELKLNILLKIDIKHGNTYAGIH
jgi:hypothetical protein